MEDFAKFDILMKLKRSKEKETKAEVHKTLEGAFFAKPASAGTA